MKSTLLISILIVIIVQFPTAQSATKNRLGDWCRVDPIPFDDPQCWETSNPQCIAIEYPDNINLTEDAKTGTYALVLETGMDSIGMPLPAVASFKNKINYRPEKVTGYYKADILTDDYASIRVHLLSDRGLIGWGILDISLSTSIYQHFEMPIHYTTAAVQPDSFSLFIYSSYDQAATGTRLVLDDLALESLTDVAIPLTERFTTRVNPNPAVDEIFIEVPQGLGLVSFRIFDSNGQIMEYEEFEDQTRINVSEYTVGLYYFEVRLKNQQLYDKGRIRIGKQRK